MARRSDEILLIGYSVFSGLQLNPSEEIVRRLSGETIHGYRVKGLVLPVSFRYVKENLPRALRENRPLLVLGIGLAPRATKPVIELAASNVASFSTSDEDGNRISYEYLEGGEPRCVHTTLPVDSILRECSNRGLRVAASVSIGTYLCGVAGYYIMRYAIESNVMGGFIHVPPSTELAMRHGLVNHMPLHSLVETIRCVLEVSAKKASQALRQSTQ